MSATPTTHHRTKGTTMNRTKRAAIALTLAIGMTLGATVPAQAATRPMGPSYWVCKWWPVFC